MPKLFAVVFVKIEVPVPSDWEDLSTNESLDYMQKEVEQRVEDASDIEIGGWDWEN